MLKPLRYVICILVFPAVVAAAENSRAVNEPKVISGMSIVGNDETPKSLYIVPWKDAEDGKDVSFTSRVLNEELSPVDKSDFIRKLGFYRNRKSD